MFYITLYLAKIISLISKIFNIGFGGTWPGHIALSIYPGLLNSRHFKLSKGCIVIAGTNGKTTTSKMVTHFLEKKGLKVVNNRSGANLLNGIVSAVLLDKNIFGKSRSDIGVFEVDEFTLPNVLEKLSPGILVLLNLSRDQLDRYGEIDIIFDKWSQAFQKMSASVSVVADISQVLFKEIPKVFKGKVTYFNDNPLYLNKTRLLGQFNAKNINAALVVCDLLGIDVEESIKYLKDFEPAYGRGESVEYKGKVFKIFLAKNPASFDNNLDLLCEGFLEADTLLYLLNDNIPDGRDISWIYDVDPERLEKVSRDKKIYVSGSRCLDMAIRLKYANVSFNKEDATGSLVSSIRKISKDNVCKNIVVLPNYSSMLQVRKILTGKKIL